MEEQNAEQKKHHFLFYIFKADKEENPMQKNKAESLFDQIKNTFNNKIQEN